MQKLVQAGRSRISWGLKNTNFSILAPQTKKSAKKGQILKAVEQVKKIGSAVALKVRKPFGTKSGKQKINYLSRLKLHKKQDFGTTSSMKTWTDKLSKFIKFF